ncbi:MAG: cobalamin B12-binding domain-containing protein [Candidatus Brocadiae bacterium]|nr:cobalamin B12-binding domain-containing protein [Candidatus Brocadiia bacterium]
MNKIRIVTAAALFDGHDVSINIFRRLLQKKGAEIIHLGHNRSVQEVVTVALDEDADAILISSYQGGHNEYFRYVVDILKQSNASHIQIFGGGGGVILPEEIESLQKYGVTKIYHATDGQKMGIDGIAEDILFQIRESKKQRKQIVAPEESLIEQNSPRTAHLSIAQQISFFESSKEEESLESIRNVYQKYNRKKSVVFGVTGTGGSGKSSLIDEIIGRFLSISEDITIGILAVDPTKSQSQGALLGDRIRCNHIYNDRVYYRSFATRDSHDELSNSVRDGLLVLTSCGFDIIFVETTGIGQGNSKITQISDYSIYVMTSEFGSPSQLEKIDMLDVAHFIAINKFEKAGSEDALREVILHYLRSRSLKASPGIPLEKMDLPIYGTSSNQFNNHAVNRLFKDMLKLLEEETTPGYSLKRNLLERLPVDSKKVSGLLDTRRQNYLAEISECVRGYHRKKSQEAQLAGKAHSLKQSIEQIADKHALGVLEKTFEERWQQLSPESQQALKSWNEMCQEYLKEEKKYTIQGKEHCISLCNTTLCGTKVPKVVPPGFHSWYEIVEFLAKENFPGQFPFTAGVFPFKRTTEDPKRQFAGEGGPDRTNKRFHYLCEGDKAKRLSVAFDGITLYGEDPSLRPDIYGKIGESGVSICTKDDMDRLLKGFDQCDPLTSVSMTINAPAPIMVAFYFLVAYKRELEKIQTQGKELSEEEKKTLQIQTFRKLRGTVQADMLKEDQGQNTCIFSIDFAMKLIGDLQEYLSRHSIRNYYSLSISGYHIAEAGANPITQLAFTLANGFTYVEYFLNRGIPVDEFAPNLSFFFSNGMDPEYSVIGRVARRIWAVAMKYRYDANDKSQRLKYHIQTSGRSLHAQEIDFNDIRTTLQALTAINDNCNSLHTNSYDEAVTTPTEESVRRSMAIQLILTKEFGLLKNENPLQGSFLVNMLTDLVEEAVLEEFDRLSRRGGVLGAMEHQYQRSKIQEQSLYYEKLKQSGEYPIVGVNTFLPSQEQNPYNSMEITRATEQEKKERLQDLENFHKQHNEKARMALQRLKEVALSEGNIFEELLHCVEYASMGEITYLLYEIGGKYRRGM